MAQRLKISPHTVKSALKRMGMVPEQEVARQGELLVLAEEASVGAHNAGEGDEAIGEHEADAGQEEAAVDADAEFPILLSFWRNDDG